MSKSLICAPDCAEAEQPDDWDEEEDGEWEPPRIANPKCEAAPGCGEWERPSKINPAYKGTWYPPMIDNPEYKVRGCLLSHRRLSFKCSSQARLASAALLQLW